jgi:hypothetical protein
MTVWRIEAGNIMQTGKAVFAERVQHLQCNWLDRLLALLQILE